MQTKYIKKHHSMKRHTPLLLLSLLMPFVAMAGIPDDYYTKADGKKKAALKAAMYDIISPHTKLGYSNLWAAYENVDYLPATNSQGRHQVMDYYSDEVYYFNGNGTAVSGMNKEHVAPQSWWGGGTGIAVGNDLFQVIPSDSKANSAKGNYPLGEVTGSVAYSNPRMKTGRDQHGDLVFEPCNEYKGDFARIFFYVATCYPDVNWQDRSDVNVSFRKEDYPTLKEDILPMLLRWSKNDPVCEWEVTRNERAYGEQGNRNPFIDFPNLAEYIWGDSVDYAFSIDGTSGSGGQGEDPTPEFAVLVDCPLTSGLDPFFVRTSEGCEGEVWTSNSSYGAVANAYSIAGKTADEYLMVSLDLSMMERAMLSFQHATGYNKTVPVEDTYFQVLVSYDYEGVPEDATWRKLDADFPALQSSGNFTQFVPSGDISLAGCCGRDNVTIAFRYTSNSSACYAWEIKDVKITAYELPDAIPFLAEDSDHSDYSDYSGYSDYSNATFDLMGRRVPANTKGLVIRNGKKILQR